MSATSRPEQHRWGFYASVLVGCLALSMLGNALHTWSRWHADIAAGIDRGAQTPWVATVGITVAPAMVIVMTEMVVISHKRNAGWARALVTALAALVGLIALVVSYSGLVHVCTTIVGLPVWLGYAAPLIVDAPIIAATIGLWDVQQRIRADRVAVADQPTATVAEVADHQVAQPVEVADQPVAEGQPATVELVADQPTATFTEVADQPVADEPGAPEMVVGQPVADDVSANLDEVVDSPVADHPPQVNVVAAEEPATVTEVADQPLATVSEMAVADSQGVADEPAATVELAADQSPATNPEVADSPVADEQPASAPPVADGGAADPGVADLARRVHEESATTKPLEDVAEVLELAEAGMSQRAIAAEVGVDRTLVSRWIKASQTLETREPQPVG